MNMKIIDIVLVVLTSILVITIWMMHISISKTRISESALRSARVEWADDGVRLRVRSYTGDTIIVTYYNYNPDVEFENEY